jgi:hypothetical protein
VGPVPGDVDLRRGRGDRAPELDSPTLRRGLLMVDLPPSRRDITTAPRRDGTIDLSPAGPTPRLLPAVARPGILRGRFATPQAGAGRAPPQLVGGDAGGDDTDYALGVRRPAHRHRPAPRRPALPHEPIEESTVRPLAPPRPASAPATDQQVLHRRRPDRHHSRAPAACWSVGRHSSRSSTSTRSRTMSLDFEFIGLRGRFHYPANIR